MQPVFEKRPNDPYNFTCIEVHSLNWVSHWHNDAELAVLESGDAKLQIGGDMYPMKAGDICLVKGRDSHAYHSDCANRFHIVQFSEHALPVPLWDSSLLFTSTPQEASELGVRIANLSVRGDGALDTMTRVAELFQLLVQLFSRSAPPAPIPSRRPYREERTDEDILAYLDAHCLEPISLESLARVFHYSPSYLSRFFKASFDMSLWDYLTSLRLKRAMHMLQHSDLTVPAIALETGFNTPRQFNRCFQKHLNRSPGEYRRWIRRLH